MSNQVIRQGGAYSYIQDVDLDIVRDITQVDTDLFWDECFTREGYDNGGYLASLKDDQIKVLSGFLPLLIPGYTCPKIDLKDYTLNPILRDNQREAIEVALDKTRGIIKMPTGIGKALVAVELCRIFLESGHRSVICVATRALLYQMKDELIKYGVNEKYIGLVGDGNKDCNKPVVVGIADSLAIGSNYDGTLLGEARLLIFDECLSGDSLVLTNKGYIKIEDKSIIGTKALSFNESSNCWEWKSIVRHLPKGKRSTVLLSTTNYELRCTKDHLVRTVDGWKKVESLQKGNKIISLRPWIVVLIAFLKTKGKKEKTLEGIKFIFAKIVGDTGRILDGSNKKD